MSPWEKKQRKALRVKYPNEEIRKLPYHRVVRTTLSLVEPLFVRSIFPTYRHNTAVVAFWYKSTRVPQCGKVQPVEDICHVPTAVCSNIRAWKFACEWVGNYVQECFNAPNVLPLIVNIPCRGCGIGNVLRMVWFWPCCSF